MKTAWLHKISDSKGIAALEFAIVFPFFLIMMLFLLEFAYQQVFITLVERWAVQATVVARTAEDPSKVTEASMRNLLTARLPKWMYAGNASKKVDLQAFYGDTLEETIQFSGERRGFGNPEIKGKGQTVCMIISVKTGFILGSVTAWLEDIMSPRIHRSIVNCYVNWDVDSNVSDDS